jgi:hypothetical protein
MATQLSILTAVLDGQADSLRNLVAALPLRDGSPFAAVAGTHNGRFVVVSPKPLAPRTMLMCSATFDTPIRQWVEGLLDSLGPNAQAIWSHCVGWPGLDAAADYLCAHHVVPSLSFATWDASVSAIVDALALRTRLERFAVRTQRLSNEQRLDAYRVEFGR